MTPDLPYNCPLERAVNRHERRRRAAGSKRRPVRTFVPTLAPRYDGLNLAYHEDLERRTRPEHATIAGGY